MVSLTPTRVSVTIGSPLFWILVAFMAIGAVVWFVSTVRGMAPAKPAATFSATDRVVRRFQDPPPAVLAAFESAVGRAPGMNVVSRGADQLYIDSRPTTQILGGDYGSALRLTVQPGVAGGTAVLVEYAPKTASAATDPHAAFVEKERVLRMKAKDVGRLTEVG